MKRTVGMKWVGNRFGELCIGASESEFRDLSFKNGPEASETVVGGILSKTEKIKDDKTTHFWDEIGQE